MLALSCGGSEARALQFNILGSFEVVDGARRVQLGGLKQRGVLAVLLLSANRVVAMDRLIDELWPGDAPTQAHNALQTYVSNLRRALEPNRAPREPARILRSEAPGYLLAIDPADVDAARFEHLAREGRELLRAGRPHDARERLTGALALWRGAALADFADEPFARSEAARLEELRAVALEDRIAADLAVGEHGAVIGELQRLVAQEPLREQLWGHLMLALYRAGRQADALAAYQRCRQTLADELGIDPSPALRQIQLDVLQQSRSLDWTPPDREPAASGGPAAGTSEEQRAIARGAPFVIYRDGGGHDHAYSLEERGTPITIGRAASADLWLSWDGRVSRLHAKLEAQGDEWDVIDDGLSSNGSFINDERVEGRRRLKDGDVLQFGDTVMTFRHPLHSSAAMTRR
jgi:DNA-binding SARP family transcriptional activator